MTFNLFLGLGLITFGIWTHYLRIKSPEKFSKLEAMKKFYGQKRGETIHLIAYTAVPIVFGILVLLKPYM